MATTDEERYVRWTFLLLKGTLFIVKKVLVRKGQNEFQLTGRDLDALLNANKRKLEHEFRHKNQRKKLFPTSGKTNVEEWDISLLAGVLQIVFRPSLSRDEHHALKTIKLQRNDVYAHRATAGVDTDSYTDICDDLQNAFDIMASGFDSKIQQECSDIIKSCLKGELDIESHLEQLKRNSETDYMLSKIIAKIEAAVKENKEENSDLKRHFSEKISRSEKRIVDIIRDIRLKQEDANAALLEVLQEQQCKRKVKKVKDHVEESTLLSNETDEHSSDEETTDYEEESGMKINITEHKSDERETACQVYHFILSVKHDAERALKAGNLRMADYLYTTALVGFELFPRMPEIAEEHPKLLCDRSLVHFRMRRFKEAENDAKMAINSCPTFIKGYWRACQAVKGVYNGIQKAIPYLVEGMKIAMYNDGEQHDIVTFLTELCTLVIKAPKIDAMEELLERNVDVPDGHEHCEIWSKVVHKLAAQKQWKSLALLFMGYNEGVTTALESIDTTLWKCNDVSVAVMFDNLTDDEINSWGETLAVNLIGRGSSIDHIGQTFGMPTLHYVVSLSLRLGLKALLKMVLEAYGGSPEKRDAQDKDGFTALHVLVQSSNANTNAAADIVKLLIDAKCDTSILDKNNKKPIDYLQPGDIAYQPLLKAVKPVSELRKELEELKSQGNCALKTGNHTQALTFYKKALEISQQSKKLYREVAIVYSNQANVYYTLKQDTEALTNAVAAISCDSTYHKGHLWNAKILLNMGLLSEAFRAYMDGYIKSEVSSDLRFNFLMEAVTLLKSIPDEHFQQCYNQLRFLDQDVWPQVLVRLSKNVDWKCIAYLILGPNLDKGKFDKELNVDVGSICTGVAKAVSTDDVQTNSVFTYLDRCDPKKEGHWLDVLLFVVIRNGSAQTLKCLVEDEDDIPLHAAVRFALKTGTTLFVTTYPGKDINTEGMGKNARGDSVFHCITKLRPPPEPDILCEVTELMMKKGLSAMARDARGKFAAEYLYEKYPGYVFDIFFKATETYTVDDITRLKEEGNVKFKAGDVDEAIHLYGKAINVVENSSREMVVSRVTHHEISVLYSNRAEGYLKLKMYKQAFDDAVKSNSFDGHWYKAHIRVGKALRGMKNMDGAMKSFVNAYRNICDQVEDKPKVEILVELATVCSCIQKMNIKKRIPEIPAGQSHIWAHACYELVSKGEWKNAAVAYYQYTMGNAKQPHLKLTLKPFCNLTMLRDYSWGVDMIYYFLECGSNRNTIFLEKGDTYLHAVVRITLCAASNMSLLQYLVKWYCQPTDTDQHRVDVGSNTVLHAATMEQKVDKTRRSDVIILLLKCEVNPNQRNKSNKLAIDYLSSDENKSREILRMAMYNKGYISDIQNYEQNGKEKQPRGQPRSDVSQASSENSSHKLRGTCNMCEDMYSQAMMKFLEGEIVEGYDRIVELLNQKHGGGRHEEVKKKALSEVIKMLGETYNPEIPKCLTSIGCENYLIIVDGLANSNKWRQLDMVVRKYRQVHGSDQLKGFASNLTVVPVVRETSLKGAEDVKLQIVTSLLNCKATLGTDNGQMAVSCAVDEEHFKVLTELVKRGAATTNLSMYDGDTPIHAALTIALGKEISSVLLEFLLDQFSESPENYPYLDPEQLDQNGDCLFHLVARANFSSHVLKLTEMLCKWTISGNYYNKDGKQPVDYIKKKNDRRIQYLRLARTIKPSREQKYGPKSGKKDNTSSEIPVENEEHQLPRSTDRDVNQKPATEVVKIISVKEKRKRYIEELIRLLPDSQHSIFKVEHTPERTQIENVGSETEECSLDSISIGRDKKVALDKNVDSDKIGENFLEDSKAVHVLADVNNSNKVKGVTDIYCRQKLTERENGEIYKAKPQITNEDAALSHDTDDDKENFGNQPLESDSESLSVEKDVEVQTLNSSNSTVEGSIDEFKYAKETLSETDFEGDAQGQGIMCPEDESEAETNNQNVKTPEADEKQKPDENEYILHKANDQADEEEQMHVKDNDDDEEEEEEEDFEIDVQVFDNLEWEVECTAEVWKTLRDKNVLPELKRRIVRKIQLLASGDWQPHLCEKMKNVPPSLNLFEAKFSEGRRIIWELAIAFSPRCSETAERRLQGTSGEITQPVRGGRIYSEIIRVWEIVLDHDRCVQRIKKSHLRGETCIIQKKLRGMKVEIHQAPLGAVKRYPMLYAEDEITEQELEEHHQEMQRFFPPASPNETEYHILKFYSFSPVLVSHILQNIDPKVDFPFRVTDLEHAIINLKSKAPILLMGRSGTGKTTCCLYRLWSQFHSNWYKTKEAGAQLLPRCVEFTHQAVEETDFDDEEDNSDKEPVADKGETAGASGCSSTADQEPADGAMILNQFDRIHQLFITKNAFLSYEVQKNFREFTHADEILREHVEHEEDILPNRLQDVQDYSFPLFLTSRQLLLMLDASIGPPFFFERKEDGALKVDIAGWTDLDVPLSFLPLINENSDAEDELEHYVEQQEDERVEEMEQRASEKRLKLIPRREITYGVFVEEIWPKLEKKTKKKGNYHPSLIWTEIMSFIKGSYEALSKPCGYLTKNEYIKLGRKQAPNFPGDRDSIYSFFTRYEHFKKQTSLFDETDLVHDAFRRLRHLKSRPWVVHQIYVDETQDFTQAELCLLIRLCHNPNDMFFTGDTAKRIMTGISYRFCDLRSLFYHAKMSMQAMGKKCAIEVPKKVYQLTLNYRSHTGILSLASSVLELMVEFFPESFDRLNPDKGLFYGPQPILLESCSFSDLAVLLRGNKRKTPHIEFGADQAILVANDATRESIPEELRLGLVLTIYEAKGLEFDDVLLYNFFKDSQAWKEWRVVTKYLERLAAEQLESGTEDYDNLVQIDHDILQSEGRPRPLNFDPNMHKVLNSELKHLYTALTRARVNVWIFDEDSEKRAPMFEYFKVRKLVKCMQVEEINEESLTETIFAEKSGPADWIRRGEDFMRHSLYSVAAKCFGMGGDHDREKIALAHGQALKASRSKENLREMREEFMYAAELYLECNKPAKAAICLQNAKERKLAAGLFEKLGQYERAAEMYRKLKRPIASSRCYEQFGKFNKAVEVLYASENFDLAIDTLRRYHMMIKDLQQSGSPVPPQLADNKPFYTEESLSHRAAELFHKHKNVDRMLEAVDRFQNIDDKVAFLENKQYISEAAKILEEDGQYEAATDLLLMYGRFNEANIMAEKTQKEEVVARCLLINCRVMMLDVEKINLHKEFLSECLEKAFEIYQSCSECDYLGQVCLLQAKLTGDVDRIKNGWKAFQGSKPYLNEAGLLECCDWLLKFGNLDNPEVLRACVRGIEYLFGVCHTLIQPNKDMQKTLKYEQFYGLKPSSQDRLVIHVEEKPLCLSMLQPQLKNDCEKFEVPKVEAHDSLVVHLLNRSGEWLKVILKALHKRRDAAKLCDFFRAGLECPNVGNVDAPCTMLHRAQTQGDFKSLIEIDVLFIEFESSVLDGAVSLKQKCGEHIKQALETYLYTANNDPINKYQTCVYLWTDLMPLSGHPTFIDNDSKDLLQYLRGNNKVLVHFKKYLLEKWQAFTAGEKKLQSNAARETEGYLLFEFGYHLLGFDTGRKRFEKTPEQEMAKLESKMDQELLHKGTDIKKNEKNYTLTMTVVDKELSSRGGKVVVTCVAHRFLDAFSLLTKNNPFEAMMQFSKFQIQLSTRKQKEYNFYPDLNHYLMWVEFYACVAVVCIAKLKNKTFPDFMFFLPSHYLALVKFIQATFPASTHSVYDAVHLWNPPSFRQFKTESLITERLKGFAMVISGQAQGVKVLNKIVESCLDDPCNFATLERLIVFNLTLVCNVGKSVAEETEKNLMSSLVHLILPENAPKRIKDILGTVRECKGIEDVAKVLINLLKDRMIGEELFVCQWRPEKKSRLETNKIQIEKFSPFSGSFLNDTTLQEMYEDRGIREQRSVIEQSELNNVEADVTPEEMEKAKRDKENQRREEERFAAVVRIQRWIRDKFKLLRMREEKRSGRGGKSQIDNIFEAMKEYQKKCTICGVIFKDKLKEKQKLYQDSFGEMSVLNETEKAWGTGAAHRQDRYEVKQISCENEPANQFDSPDLTAAINDIRTSHFEDASHIRAEIDYHRFEKNYRENVGPKLKTLDEFINNDIYRLKDEEFVAKKYDKHELAIIRMKNKIKEIEKDILMVLMSREWSGSKTGRIQQNMAELESDFLIVKPYVEEVQAKIKQDEANIGKAEASSSGTSQVEKDFDDDIDDIVKVVEEPVNKQTKKYKKREFRSRNRGKRQLLH